MRIYASLIPTVKSKKILEKHLNECGFPLNNINLHSTLLSASNWVVGEGFQPFVFSLIEPIVIPPVGNFEVWEKYGDLLVLTYDRNDSFNRLQHLVTCSFSQYIGNVFNDDLICQEMWNIMNRRAEGLVPHLSLSRGVSKNSVSLPPLEKALIFDSLYVESNSE